MADSVFARIGLAGSIVLLVFGFLFTSGVLVGGMVAGFSPWALLTVGAVGLASVVIGTMGIVQRESTQ